MDWIVLLPPVVAIVLALWTRQVFLSLFAGMLIGTIILVGGNPIVGLRELVEQLVRVFSDAGNTRIVFFCLLVGGLVALVQASGGVDGFINWAQSRGLGKSRRGAELLAWTVGILVFVESSITSLTVGAVSRPLFDRQRLAREKLAYYCDATSAPVCMMIPLNGWGAYVLGLLEVQGYASDIVALLAKSLLFNFFALFAIALSLVFAITGWSFGPMRKAEERARDKGQVTRPDSSPMISDEVVGLASVTDKPRARDLVIPIATMVGMIFVGLFITGDGQIMKGSGSTSVLWAVGTAILVAAAMYAVPRDGKALMTPMKVTDVVLKGCAGLLPATILIVFAFALGQISRDLSMGPYIVGLIGSGTPSWWLPGLVFVVGCLISFALGSSWTTFAILIPIALPLAEGVGIPAPLMLGAVLSGGVYGDHASPLSDTSIISSLASACDHVDHVNTQLPYTLALAGLSVVAFVVAGLVA